MKVGYKALIEAARQTVNEMTPAEVQAARADPSVVLVDVRDVRELEREGKIAGAFHCPRGMLEFWIDPESPYFKSIFGEHKHFIFYCAAGWRSVLSAKTAQTMGLEKVSHLEGGFAAWKAANGAIEHLAKK